jgi:cytochrome c oxidase subunit III
MEATVIRTGTEGKTWGGGNEPLRASYGKMMMWFFILSDALTFSGFLAAYGFSRFKFIDSWPIADEVFNHFPFLHGVDAPMYYVALMTFILIFSSVTMVLAVDAGHQMKKNKVVFYMFLTIIGGVIFLGSQAWEWKNFINGEYGAVATNGNNILQFVDKMESVWRWKHLLPQPHETEYNIPVPMVFGLQMSLRFLRFNCGRCKGRFYGQSKPFGTYTAA